MTIDIVVSGHCTWLWWSDILWKSTWHEERFSGRILKENIGRLSLSLKLSGTRLASIKRAPRASRFSPSFITIAPKIIIFFKIASRASRFSPSFLSITPKVKICTKSEQVFPKFSHNCTKSNNISQNLYQNLWLTGKVEYPCWELFSKYWSKFVIKPSFPAMLKWSDPQSFEVYFCVGGVLPYWYFQKKSEQVFTKFSHNCTKGKNISQNVHQDQADFLTIAPKM